ncbi:IucA/IucC family protein [Nonomuraea sp. NPDC049695]|uniref:IucA/IucC family protein n=1 Tax=Nonomuraea sp. NPDC049695 TaxID=3154734 RepID=UPI003413EE26
MRRSEAEFAADLALLRPELSAAYMAALPDARAAVLGRLWRSLLYEPLPGLVTSSEWRPAARVQVPLADGRRLMGRARKPYDLGGEPALWLNGHPYTHPAELLAALGLPGTDQLVADLDNSVASLALSRAQPLHTPGTPEEHEQSVVDGHPYHPGCRSRPGVSVAEQLAYMPEHRPVVHLDLLAVPAADCLVSGPWPGSLMDGDRLLLPVHPWQSAHVLPGLGLRPHVTAAVPARPLMSVRTLAPLDGGPHIKTAFSTRMTSGVRDISPGSVRDCVHLSHLLTVLSARQGGRPRIARYLAGAAAMVNGEHSPDLAAMLREPTGPAIPVGAVTAAMVRDPAAWLAAFARLTLSDLLGLLALGVALEAHGQNLLVELDRDGMPYRLVYRDLADVRISPARLARNGVELPPVSARLLADDPGTLHAKLFGGLVGTTFGSLIALFGRGDRAEESRLWDVVATAARSVEFPCAIDRRALFGPHLTVKAHLLTRLEGAPPGDSWTRLPNPLGA